MPGAAVGNHLYTHLKKPMHGACVASALHSCTSDCILDRNLDMQALTDSLLSANMESFLTDRLSDTRPEGWNDQQSLVVYVHMRGSYRYRIVAQQHLFQQVPGISPGSANQYILGDL